MKISTNRNTARHIVACLALLAGVLALGGLLLPSGTGAAQAASTGTRSGTGEDVYGVREVTGGGTPTPTPTATPCPPGEWSVVDSPSPSGYNNLLTGISVLSADNIWAVGYTNASSQLPAQTLIIHWDGNEWTTVPSPNAGGSSNWLYGVNAIAPNDVWAVGYYRHFNPDPIDLNLILHYNGTTWEVEQMVPNVGTYNNHLHSVSASGPFDVWAVGSYKASLTAPEQTLILWWNGEKWAPVASPNANTAGYNILRGIDVLSATDAWAVGYYDPPSGPDQTLVLRWNGTAWAISPSANAPTGFSLLYSVDALGPNDVWAVGYNSNPPGQVLPLVTRWNGTQWSYVPAPAPGTQSNWLYGVTVLSPTDVWVFGQQNSGAGSRTLSMRWDGAAWNVMATANATGANYVTGGEALASGDAWLIGYSGPAGAYRTLTTRYTAGPCGPTPSPTPTAPASTTTPTPKPTQVAPTGTATATGTAAATHTPTPPQPSATPMSTGTATATNTPGIPGTTPTGTTVVATPTACALEFSDVPVTNTFYPFVRCLACQDIIQGYACGGTGEPCNANDDPYFRPNNPVTRGQIAKIVSLAAGFRDTVPPTQQSFEDVVYGSPFWEFIERLYTREVIGGYLCGIDPNEPCVPPAERPYFRPNAGATRGQLVKITTEAEGFTDTIPNDQQTFTDVEPGSTFWLYIERLLLNRPDAIAGYPCGGPNEPCDDQDRPYFRTNNGVTRGQASKIVANTFSPGCNPAVR